MTGKHRREDDGDPRHQKKNGAGEPRHLKAGSDLPPRGKGVQEVNAKNSGGRKGSKR